MAFAGERLSDDALGFRACINISGIDEIDAVVQCMVNDAGGCPLISPFAKSVRAQTELRNLQSAVAKTAVVNLDPLLYVLIFL